MSEVPIICRMNRERIESLEEHLGIVQDLITYPSLVVCQDCGCWFSKITTRQSRCPLCGRGV